MNRKLAKAGGNGAGLGVGAAMEKDGRLAHDAVGAALASPGMLAVNDAIPGIMRPKKT